MHLDRPRTPPAVTHPLQAEALEYDEAGRPWSSRYGDVYGSRDGALGQARHVYLGGNGLPGKWAGQRQFVILEMGFGLGNNFLATWQAWREDPLRPALLHFVSVEKHPLRVQDMQAPERATAPVAGLSDSLAALADAHAPLRAQLAARWPLPLPGLHRLEFEDGCVVLTLALGDALDVVPQLALGADAFFLDGFAPDRNPSMWEPRLVKALARLARPGASAASYTCARPVLDALASSGFEVHLPPGYGKKRQMLSARYAPRWKMRRVEPPASHGGARDAIVIGAGLAGCASARALVRRGWSVRLLERGAGPAQAASALPAGLLHPLLSADDNLASRLSRAGYLYSLAQLQDIGAGGGARASLWSACGVFQQAADAAQALALREQLAARAWPPAYAAFLDADAAATRLGLAPRFAGTWFAQGAVVAAARWCEVMLEAARSGAAGAGTRIEATF